MSGKKVIVIGAGHVGRALVFPLLLQGIADEVGLLDIFEEETKGHVLDVAHGLRKGKVFQATYEDAKDADIVVLAIQAKNAVFDESDDRLSLLKENAIEAKRVTEEVMKSGFQGIFVVITNPVDIIARVVYEASGFPASRVIGTGTLLDTARLTYILAERYQVSPEQVNGYRVF